MFSLTKSFDNTVSQVNYQNLQCIANPGNSGQIVWFLSNCDVAWGLRCRELCLISELCQNIEFLALTEPIIADYKNPLIISKSGEIISTYDSSSMFYKQVLENQPCGLYYYVTDSANTETLSHHDDNQFSLIVYDGSYFYYWEDGDWKTIETSKGKINNFGAIERFFCYNSEGKACSEWFLTIEKGVPRKEIYNYPSRFDEGDFCLGKGVPLFLLVDDGQMNTPSDNLEWIKSTLDKSLNKMISAFERIQTSEERKNIETSLELSRKAFYSDGCYCSYGNPYLEDMVYELVILSGTDYLENKNLFHIDYNKLKWLADDLSETLHWVIAHTTVGESNHKDMSNCVDELSQLDSPISLYLEERYLQFTKVVYGEIPIPED